MPSGWIRNCWLLVRGGGCLVFLLHVWLSQRGIRSGKLYRSGVRVAGACAASTRPRPSVTCSHPPYLFNPYLLHTTTTGSTHTVQQIIIPLINTHIFTVGMYTMNICFCPVLFNKFVGRVFTVMNFYVT